MLEVNNLDKILILDFGSQYTQLIARRIREENVYCEIHPYNISLDKITSYNPKGIILSGGPSSVYDEAAPHSDIALFELNIPVLGICYGMQLMSYQLGGRVIRSDKREYGRADIEINNSHKLFENIDINKFPVWMSHGDKVEEIPSGFIQLASSDNTRFAAVVHPEKNLFGVQFHPEVVHTSNGINMLNNFVFSVCNCSGNWNLKNFTEVKIKEIKETVGDKNIICALSGGVDS